MKNLKNIAQVLLMSTVFSYVFAQEADEDWRWRPCFDGFVGVVGVRMAQPSELV